MMYSEFSKVAVPAFAVLLTLPAVFFGGNLPLAQGFLPILCAFLLVSGTFVPTTPFKAPVHKLFLMGIFIPLVFVMAWGIVQALPLSSPSLISPFWNIIPKAALEQDGAGALSLWSAISVNPSATLAYMPYAIGLLGAAWALFRLGQVNPLAILKIVATVVTLISLYGIIIFISGNGSVLWLPKTDYTNSLTATFINRNSYATFAGMGLLACFGLSLQRIGEISGRLDARQRLRAFWLLVLRPNKRWLGMALICFMALLLTSSSAGITASLCGLIVMLGWLAGMREPVRWPLLAMILAIMVISLTILSTTLPALDGRSVKMNGESSQRASIMSATSLLIDQQPLLGSGYGAYETALHSARHPKLLTMLSASVEHAHNTYFELAAELGYPVMVLFAISGFSLLLAFLTGLRLRRRAIMWPALGVATVVLVGGHALVDFNLSIPAVAITATALLMAALGQSFPTEEQGAITAKPLVTIPAVVLALALVGVSVWQTAANYQAFRAEPTLRSLAANAPVGPGPIFQAQSRLLKCLEINPYNSTCREGIAQTYLSLSTGYGANSAVGMVYLNMAKQAYLNAVASSPVNPLAWYRLARIEAYLGNKEEALGYLVNSVLTGPGEPLIAVQRVPLMLSFMPLAEADNVKLFSDNILDTWYARQWLVGTQVNENPTVYDEFARILATQPDAASQWKQFVRAPLPQALQTQ